MQAQGGDNDQRADDDTARDRRLERLREVGTVEPEDDKFFKDISIYVKTLLPHSCKFIIKHQIYS